MNRSRLLASFSLSIIAAWGCGDPLTNEDYHGQPLNTVQGTVQLAVTEAPVAAIKVLLAWPVPQTSSMWIARVESVSGGFPARHTLDLLVPPPQEALKTDPETGGKLGFAFLAFYEDVDGDGLHLGRG